MSACKKSYLDLPPLNYISANDVWKSADLMRLYVNGLYRRIESGIQIMCDNSAGPMSVITDEARSAYIGATANTEIIRGLYTTADAPLNDWNLEYTSIRNANVFLDNVAAATVSDDVKTSLTGEVKFLRAFFYFELVKRFGGVPLISSAQDLSDSLLVHRNTLKECYDFIGKDLDDAASMLPSTNNAGLACKWAALALESRVMLYAASYAQFGEMDPDGFGAIEPAQAQTYWQKAYDAATNVINNGPYQLYTDLSKLFIPQGGTPSVESIFEIQYNPPARGHGFHFVNGPNTENPNWTSCTNPTQQLVDAFPMKNGLPIADPLSGYDPQDPYTDRDARLDASVLHNNSPWRDIYSRAPTVIDTKPGGANQIVDRDFPASITHTGYYIHKFIDPAVTPSTELDGMNYINWVELRLGEVLLNQAEAAVELNKLQDAVDAITKLRDRAGTQTPFTVAVGADSLRNIVRNERRIELCFENHRLWDLRRWHVAEQALNGFVANGMWVTQNGSTLQYEIKPADVSAASPRVFLPKHYLFPIPFSEMQRNPNLKQNPGW
jgi:hypothetical protein